MTSTESAGTFAVMTLDITTAILAKVGDFQTVLSELAQQLRELTGARTVVIMQTTCVACEDADYRLLRVVPERRAKLLEGPEGRALLGLAAHVEAPTIWSVLDEAEPTTSLLRSLEHGATLVLPLLSGNERVGALLALGLMDRSYAESLMQVQSALSGMIAIIIKNSLLIEESRQRTRELQDREEQYRQMFNDHSAIMLLIDPHSGSVVEANPAAAKFYGRPVEEFDAMFVHDIDTRSAEQVRQWRNEVLKGKRVCDFARHRLASGESRDVEVHAVSIQVKGRTLLYLIIHDITSRVQAEQEVERHRAQLEDMVEARTFELAQANRELRSEIEARRRLEQERTRLAMAIEQSAEDIVITDTEGTIQYVNPAFEKITGFPRSEAVGENPRILKSGKQPESFYRDLWDTILRGDVWRDRIVNKRKDGGLITEDCTISPIRDENGTISHFVAVRRDVTYQVELEAQLRQSHRMEAIGQLAGGVAHDFNNILQAMLGYGKFLLDRLDADSLEHEFAQEVHQAAERAAGLTRQLLAFSRRQVLERRDLEANDLIQNLLKMIGRLLGEHIDLSFRPAPKPLFVHADAGQLEQVLLNLCVNARDAMPDGGRLTIKIQDVALDDDYCEAHAWAKPGKYVMVLVSDTGCGMDTATKERAFEPFFTTKGLGQGTGLGLATVYGIVKQHDGLIDIHSEPGQGTTFKIYLSELLSRSEDAGNTKREKPAGGRENILLAEDDETVRRVTARILESAGYFVIQARNGEEAMELIRHVHEEIDLLLSDVVMPKGGGMEVVDLFRQLEPAGGALLMSGYSTGNFGTSDLEARRIGFIQKPCTVDALLRKIRELLR